VFFLSAVSLASAWFSDPVGVCCFTVQDRVVPLWVRRREGAAQGEVVLRELHLVPKEAERQVRYMYGLGARRW
jgi:hypothetical protein